MAQEIVCGEAQVLNTINSGLRSNEFSRKLLSTNSKKAQFYLKQYIIRKIKQTQSTFVKLDKLSTQVDYVMCRRRNLKEMCDCKVILNECVAKQHRMVVCKMALMLKKKKAEKVKPKIRWWKLKETSCQEAFRQEVTRILGGKDGLPDEWDKTAEILKKQLKLYWE